MRNTGVGWHFVVVVKERPNQVIAWGKCVYAIEWLYFSAIPFPKFSIPGVDLRIFINARARLVCYGLFIFLYLTWLSFTLVVALQCRPLALVWIKNIQGGRYIDEDMYYKFSSAPNIVSDLVMLFLPIPTVIRLRLSWPRRMGLLLTFMVGSI